MGFENKAGINVYNYYGARGTGGSVGSEHTQNSVREYSVAFTGESLNSGFLPPVYVPKGSLLRKAVLRVDEAFAVSAAGTVAFGGAVPGTNGAVITETQLENIGTKDVSATAIGTWATASTTGTAAQEKITIAITGTVTATQGKGTLILEFVNKTKA